MHGKSITDISSLSPNELESLVTLAKVMKVHKGEGREEQILKGKQIALLFEKDSTRTRCAFEVAARDQGAHTTYLGEGSQMGKKESYRDTARVLGRLFDGIMYRGNDQQTVLTLAENAGVPVWNGLTDESHPTQALADLLTIRENSYKSASETKVCFLGTADNNVARSLMTGCAKMGIAYAAAAPAAYHPSPELVEMLRKTENARITLTENVAEAVLDADFLYTDVWLSMGEPETLWEERIRQLSPYQINRSVMEMTGNPDCRLLHCLPAFHNTDTLVGKKIFELFGIREMEVTDEVFESPASLVFDQAENRMHTIKAVLMATLTDLLSGEKE